MSNVESPQHYTSGYIEVIYAIHDVLGREGFKAFCMGNYIKYNARANHKGLRAEDLAKADQYLEWATNGLPAPINGRVPRQPDLYERVAEAMATPTPLQAGEAIHEAVEREIKASPELGAGYGEAASPTKPIDVRSGPTAKTVANAIGPAIQAIVGCEVMKTVRLRVTKRLNECETHGTFIYFTAEIYDREDDDQITSAMIIADEPDEEVCGMVAGVLASDIQHYFS